MATPLDTYLVWMLVAIAFAVVELLTGTFYLLVLGFAAAAGSAAAYVGLPMWAQAASAAVVAIVGAALVQRYRAGVKSAGRINAVDVGHRVTLDSWVNEAAGLARVHYRGTLWDAKVIGERGVATTFYIRGVDGATLHIAPERA